MKPIQANQAASPYARTEGSLCGSDILVPEAFWQSGHQRLGKTKPEGLPERSSTSEVLDGRPYLQTPSRGTVQCLRIGNARCASLAAKRFAYR